MTLSNINKSRLEEEFIRKLKFIIPRIAVWLQYTGCEVYKSVANPMYWSVTLNFCTSTGGIGFSITVDAGKEEPFIDFSQAYSYFRELKYKQVNESLKYLDPSSPKGKILSVGDIRAKKRAIKKQT